MNWQKVFGWIQFGLMTGASFVASGAPVPHGWAQWLLLIGSAATAVANHAHASQNGNGSAAK